MDRLDLTGVPCPQNTARALLALECAEDGALVEILLDDGEPVRNVPASLEMEGHTVLRKDRQGSQWVLLVVPGGEE